MSEAIGMAGMIETPVVVVNVQRGGPSTGLPTKTEQGDLNQAIGASQGDFPRVIVAPRDATDCFYTAVEAFNLAETFQLPVIIISDLLLGEHPLHRRPGGDLQQVPIERGEWVETLSPDDAQNGGYKRYALTPRNLTARPSRREGLIHVSGTDDHDEHGILISDEHTNPASAARCTRSGCARWRACKPASSPRSSRAEPEPTWTLIGWGSTWSVITRRSSSSTAPASRPIRSTSNTCIRSTEPRRARS